MAETNLSPLAPAWCRGEGERPSMPPVAGVSLATAAAGIKYRDRTDLMVMVFDRPVVAAGVFTTSRCASAPVEWCRANLGRSVRAIVVNSGNANAFTGAKGSQACRVTADAAATALGCDPSEIALASTGVIGEPMDATKFAGLLTDLCSAVEPDRWWDCASAIMTTDTYPKAATRTFKMNGKTHRISGIAKGSGMIAPDMATMLAFVVTDAAVAQADLQSLLAKHVGPTFNSITVDSDTSTSDTLMAFATGTGEVLRRDTEEFDTFGLEMLSLFRDLSEQLVRDGEGATKHVTIDVSGAVSDSSAKTIALAIANSPLVKTAIAGEDANWGRVVMAVGKAGEPADRDRLEISFGVPDPNGDGYSVSTVARHGERVPDYDEQFTSDLMKSDRIVILVDLGLEQIEGGGSGFASVQTCDLTHDYITINGDYRS